MDVQTLRDVCISDLTKEELSLKNNTIEELKSKLGNPDIPETDTDTRAAMIPETLRDSSQHHHTTQPLINDGGLIVPRKPANPVRENPERQNLHRELLFNQKIGKNVLNQKTELQRALEKQKENLARKKSEDNSRVPELEKVIADRQKRLQSPNEDKNEDDKVLNKELLEIRMKLKTRSEPK